MADDTLLITPAELAGLGEPPVLLDVRWRLGGPPGIEAYRAGHVPGAVFVDLDRDLAAPAGAGGRHPLPAAGDFQAAMRRVGVSAGRMVVVYDEADSAAAARAWWLLRYFGHTGVRVLDGGYQAWRAAGLPVSENIPAPDSPPVEGDFTARPGHLPLLDAAGAAALAKTGLLLDARAAERYRGETEPMDPVAGHIPGAVSAPTAQNINPDGTFRSPAELKARFAALATDTADRAGTADTADRAGTADTADRAGTADTAGRTGTADTADTAHTGTETGAGSAPAVGAYCGSGVTAAHEVLALALAGIPAALYAGSWSEWVTDPSRPVATGPHPD